MKISFKKNRIERRARRRAIIERIQLRRAYINEHPDEYQGYLVRLKKNAAALNDVIAEKSSNNG